MAIINSVLTGKAKGKIGNIVLATVKGQTTAREYNPNPTYSDTAGQTLQRGRLRNAVLAWQFLNVFFAYAKPLAKSTESVYNAFIRLIVNLLPEAVYTSRALAAANALDLVGYSGNFAVISDINAGAGSIDLTLDTSYFPWVQGTKLVLLSFNSITGYRYVKVISLTELQWINGEITTADALFTGTSAAAYIVSADGSKMSNVLNV